jgi:hypothetical protein
MMSQPDPPEALILALASVMWNPDEPDLAATRMAPVLGWTPSHAQSWIKMHWQMLQDILVDVVMDEFQVAAAQCTRADIADFARRFDALSIDLTELAGEEADTEEATEALIATHGIPQSISPWLFEVSG